MTSAPLAQPLWFAHEILGALGLDGAETLSRTSVSGDDRLPARFAVTELAAGSIAAAGALLAALIAERTGTAPAVRVANRAASLWFGGSVAPLGWALPPVWDALAGDYRGADGWIRLHTNAPHHRAAALDLLGTAPTREAVAHAVGTWPIDALETAIVAAGGCAAALRTSAAWDRHPQGRAVSQEPLVATTLYPAAPPPAWPLAADRPLAGVRVLDMTRILAGPVATRFLAGYGADVLRLDPPGWDEPSLAPEVTVGKRCARLDLCAAWDRRRFETLLAEADILVHGYRPDALSGLGYDAATRRAINPGLIDITLNAYGWTGPWATRRGFDSLVQMSSGLAHPGTNDGGPPTPLPVQALDHATGYLMAAAALCGLRHRIRTGAGFAASCALARTAALLAAGGCDHAPPPIPMAAPAEPDFTPTPEASFWGPLHRLAPPLILDGAHQRWDQAASPLGTATAQWCR